MKNKTCCCVENVISIDELNLDQTVVKYIVDC